MPCKSSFAPKRAGSLLCCFGREENWLCCDLSRVLDLTPAGINSCIVLVSCHSCECMLYNWMYTYWHWGNLGKKAVESLHFQPQSSRLILYNPTYMIFFPNFFWTNLWRLYSSLIVTHVYFCFTPRFPLVIVWKFVHLISNTVKCHKERLGSVGNSTFESLRDSKALVWTYWLPKTTCQSIYSMFWKRV
jgi:hypothetical protein